MGQHLQRLARDESALAAALKHVTASTGCFLEMVESVETFNDECTWSGFELMLQFEAMKKRRFLGVLYIGDYTILYRDYDKPLSGSLLNNQHNGK